MLRRLLPAAVVVLAFAVGACGGGEGSGDGDAKTTAPKQSDSTTPMEYEVEAKGDLTFSVGERVPVRVLTITSDNPELRAVTLLSVGPPTPLDTPAGKMRLAFDLTRFRGDGTYSIRAGSPRDLLAVDASKQQEIDQSNVLFQLWPDGNTEADPEVFDKAVQPCPLVVENDGRSGRLTCPALTNDSGKQFSIEMRWGKP